MGEMLRWEPITSTGSLLCESNKRRCRYSLRRGVPLTKPSILQAAEIPWAFLPSEKEQVL